MDTKRYPKNWRAISQRIRERAHDRCEKCGVQNHRYIWRSADDPADYIWYDSEQDYYRLPDGTPIKMSETGEYADKATYIVLTVAHLDHNPMNNADDNLQALCQRCHLKHDGKQHAKTAAITRRRKYEQQQPPLPGVDV